MSSASICHVMNRQHKPVSTPCLPFPTPAVSRFHLTFFSYSYYYTVLETVSFPNHIASILSSSVMLQCRHFPFCTEMTESVRKHIETLKKVGNNCNNAATKRRDYWSDSARSLGLFDSDAGVQVGPRFEYNELLSKEVSPHDTHRILPSPNFDDAWNNTRTNHEVANHTTTPSMNDIPSFPESNVAGLPRANFVSPFEPIDNPHTSITNNDDNQLLEQLVIGSTLLTMEDRDLVPDYIFLSMAQLIPNQLIAEDRIGAYRFRPVGFQGLCCRYCHGYQPGPGKCVLALLSKERNFNIPNKLCLL